MKKGILFWSGLLILAAAAIYSIYAYTGMQYLFAVLLLTLWFTVADWFGFSPKCIGLSLKRRIFFGFSDLFSGSAVILAVYFLHSEPYQDWAIISILFLFLSIPIFIFVDHCLASKETDSKNTGKD